MSYKQQINKSKGFTIIEVLIVLAIAGLILLIVFLAVPALQRSARNTQRKDDVSAMLGAMSEFADNNDGTVPNGTSPAAGDALTAGTVAFTNSNVTDPANSNAKVGYYTVAPTIEPFPGTAPTILTSDTVVIYTGAECDGNVAEAGSANAYVAVYGVETGTSTYTQNCVE